ncbi:hypothetical protein QQ020_23780 [Fulvivirgaceae bacterium BMA12]|uniref:Uncharacterized protein n=1 Tax=Agaribacillus aureus TaxID=3051825 RepID=A0ABT8LBJ3_9BACT|nr:hypothetical protein [Fulvivirgaceae bacterium BMA12]
MEKDSFYTWLISNVKKSITLKVVLIISIVSIGVSCFAGLISLNSFLSNDARLGGQEFFLYLNFSLHLILIISALRWKITKPIKFNEVELNFYNQQRYLTFLKSNNDEPRMEFYFEKANENVFRFLKYWKKIWISWLGLYFVVILAYIIYHYSTSDIKNLSIILSGFLQNLFNNLSSLYFLICFIVLSSYGYSAVRKNKPKGLTKITLTFISITLIEFLVRLILSPVFIREYTSISLYLLEENPLDELNLLFSIISGLIAVVSIALVVGRLESKFINSPLWIIIMLYCYAGLQVFIRDFQVDPSGYLMIWVMYSALFLKTIFLIYAFWLVNTKRLFFYFLAINRLHVYISNEWEYIKNTFIIESNVKNIDVSGEWEILEEYKNGRTKGNMVLSQEKNGTLKGVLVLNDWMQTGNGLVRIFTVEETIEGNIQNSHINIRGTKVKILEGTIDNYYLDNWNGNIINDENIVGKSIDENGIEGHFILKRNY